MRYVTQSKTARLLTVWLLACGLVLTQGCGVRTILVRPGEPLQIREPVKAKVWVFGADGVPVDSEATIPAGWYVIDAPDKTSER